MQPAAGTNRGMEDRSAPSSAKRAHTPPPALSQISPQPDVETSAVPVLGDAMEANALCSSEASGLGPLKERRLSDDWLWYVVKALHGMRESSKAIILQETLPAYCIQKIKRLKTGEILYERRYLSPRPPPKISLRHDHKWDQRE